MTDTDQRPVVPFIPWRCPSCRSTKPRSYGQRGRTRYHRCQACGCEFLSRELDPAETLAGLPQARGLALPTMRQVEDRRDHDSLPETLLDARELARLIAAPERAVAAAAPRLRERCQDFPPASTWRGRTVFDRVEAEAFLDRGRWAVQELRQAALQIVGDTPRRPPGQLR